MYIFRIQEFLYVEFRILVMLENFSENLFPRSLLMQNPFLPAIQISFELRIGKEKKSQIRDLCSSNLFPVSNITVLALPTIRANFTWIPGEYRYERSRCLHSKLGTYFICSMQFSYLILPRNLSNIYLKIRISNTLILKRIMMNLLIQIKFPINLFIFRMHFSCSDPFENSSIFNYRFISQLINS